MVFVTKIRCVYAAPNCQIAAVSKWNVNYYIDVEVDVGLGLTL